MVAFDDCFCAEDPIVEDLLVVREGEVGGVSGAVEL